MNIDTRLVTGTQIFIWRKTDLYKNIQLKDREKKLDSKGFVLLTLFLFVCW